MSYESIDAGNAPALSALAHKLLQRATREIEYGQLIVKTPSGRTQVLGRLGFGPTAILHIHDWKFVWRLLTSWDVGFAESYMAGEWSSPDLPALLNILCRNARMGASSRTMGLVRSLPRLGHVLNRNTRRGSRRNIAAHYDLGNAFYAQWLDRSLSYSSALYRHGGQTLEDAQQEKLDRIVELLELSGRERVLEIGCGWGGLAEQLLDRHGCNLTALTLSSEQREHTRNRLRRHIEKKNCDLRLQDYRDADDAYDRVVSIEMLEAVGESYWPVYFDKLRERLTPEGIAVLQVITIGEEHFETYRKYPDFIQKYIFPGGMLPTAWIVKQQIERSGMKLVSSELFGGSYARTLIEWRERFHHAWPNIEPLGFDIRFKRMWDYYLAYCQAGFEAGVLNVGLYKITRAS
jgi:cyclopropane-fatty-acyl-phospholipid synthase